MYALKISHSSRRICSFTLLFNLIAGIGLFTLASCGQAAPALAASLVSSAPG